MHKLKYLIFLATLGLIAFPFLVQSKPTTIVESKTIHVSPTPTPTPIPQAKTASIVVDNATKTCEITGQNAWECIKSAFGVENLKYDDYGGNLGVFITGFNGHNAGENEFWEFSVNGASSSVGISSYIPVENDVLSFNLKTF